MVLVLSLLVLCVSVALADDNSNLITTATDSMATVQTKSGTESNPGKCVLQFQSFECDDNCAELNGYELECVSKGVENGKDKKMCECKAEDANTCQDSANPNATSGTVPQFGECSDQLQCVDSYGYIATSTEEGPICAEKLHCVQEINTTATEPASICHTCKSCIAQNDAADKLLAGVKRFNCSAICSQKKLESEDERNPAGVGIADSHSSAGSDESINSTGSSAVSNSDESDNSTGFSAASAVTQANVAAILLAIVAVAL